MIMMMMMVLSFAQFSQIYLRINRSFSCIEKKKKDSLKHISTRSRSSKFEFWWRSDDLPNWEEEKFSFTFPPQMNLNASVPNRRSLHSQLPGNKRQNVRQVFGTEWGGEGGGGGAQPTSGIWRRLRTQKGGKNAGNEALAAGARAALCVSAQRSRTTDDDGLLVHEMIHFCFLNDSFKGESIPQESFHPNPWF